MFHFSVTFYKFGYVKWSFFFVTTLYGLKLQLLGLNRVRKAQAWTGNDTSGFNSEKKMSKIELILQKWFIHWHFLWQLNLTAQDPLPNNVRSNFKAIYDSSILSTQCTWASSGENSNSVYFCMSRRMRCWFTRRTIFGRILLLR